MRPCPAGSRRGYVDLLPRLQSPRSVRLLMTAHAESERDAYAAAMQWHWQRQQPEGKTLGNAAGFAFEVDLTTLTRETAQNSLDELLAGEQTVDLEYTVIELGGDDL